MSLDVHQVLGIAADSAEDPEHALHEEWRLDRLASTKWASVVEMADVVALELEARPLPPRPDFTI